MTTKSKTAEMSVAEETVAVSAKGFEQTMAAVKEGVEKATKGFETTQAQFKEGVEKAMKTAEDLVAFGQGNVEALLKSGQVWVAGVQDLSRRMATSAQTSFEDAISTLRSLAGAKSLKETMDLQLGFARSAMEKAMSETTRFTDASVKLAEEVAAPLTARFALAAETFSRAA